MSRPIKFRAWDGDKMWVMPNLFIGVGQIGFSDEHYVDLGMHDNEKVELMQYTGLKDKNGVEIYESDIVRHWWLKTADPEVRAIVYYENGFYLDDGLHSNWDAEDAEVIGNIYENPELLEAQS